MRICEADILSDFQHHADCSASGQIPHHYQNFLRYVDHSQEALPSLVRQRSEEVFGSNFPSQLGWSDILSQFAEIVRESQQDLFQRFMNTAQGIQTAPEVSIQMPGTDTRILPTDTAHPMEQDIQADQVVTPAQNDDPEMIQNDGLDIPPDFLDWDQLIDLTYSG